MEVWGKPRREGNKYERVFGGSAFLGWNGKGPGRCRARQVSAEGWTGQQLASTEPSSGVASYHAGVGLGSTGWLIASDGRGQHGVGLHKSPSVDQASKTQEGTCEGPAQHQ